MIIDNDLLSMQEARILAENAKEAQTRMLGLSQDKLNSVIKNIASSMIPHIKALAKISHEETGYGSIEDKIIKNEFVCTKLVDRLSTMKNVGIIEENIKEKVLNVGVPLGVLVGICPSTNPVSTTIYKAFISIASGNAIIFSPHTRAKKTISYVLDLLIDYANKAGLPDGSISYLKTVTLGGTRELINHKNVSLIINTGVPSMLKEIEKTAKPFIYGGSGNGPAFIERTANIKKAVSNIILSKTFDNGIVSAAEHSVVVDKKIEKEVEDEFLSQGAYFMDKDEEDAVINTIFKSNGDINPETVGKTALHIAKMAGFKVKSGTKVLISKQKYVTEENLYTKELLSPILSYYVEDDWQDACEKCIEILLYDHFGHTLVIHSNNPSVIEQFAIRKPVGRMLINTPASLGGIGISTNLFPAMTLGSGMTGIGVSSDNISPRNLIYQRKIGYGLDVEQIYKKTAPFHNENSNCINTTERINDIFTLGELDKLKEIFDFPFE